MQIFIVCRSAGKVATQMTGLMVPRGATTAGRGDHACAARWPCPPARATGRNDEPQGKITRVQVWCSMLDSNQRPPACEAGALPTELIDRDEKLTPERTRVNRRTQERAQHVPRSAGEAQRILTQIRIAAPHRAPRAPF